MGRPALLGLLASRDGKEMPDHRAESGHLEVLEHLECLATLDGLERQARRVPRARREAPGRRDHREASDRSAFPDRKDSAEVPGRAVSPEPLDLRVQLDQSAIEASASLYSYFYVVCQQLESINQSINLVQCGSAVSD